MGKKKSGATSSTGGVKIVPIQAQPSCSSVSDSKRVDNEPIVPEELQPITHELFRIKISEFIFSMRLQNGLRHNDAIRYHKYCSRRLSRLRNKLKHKNGRHRFVAKPLPNDFVDERYLHLPLVEAERSYARHLEMQHIQSTPPNPNGLIHTENGNVKPSLVVHWAKRRLAKAVVNSSRLLAYCERHCDKQTIMEAKAYRELFAGMMAGEKRLWESSMESLLESRRLYVQLASLASAEPNYAAAVNDQLSTIDLHLRTASYYLARTGVDVNSLRFNIETQSEEMTKPQSKLIALYWRGIQISLPELLVHSAKLDDIYTTVTSNLSSPQSLISHRDHSLQQLLSDFLGQPKYWQTITERYLTIQKASDDSLSLIHASLLASDTSDESETGHFFLLESLARDYQQCSLVEMNFLLLVLRLLEYLQPTVQGTSKTTNRCHPSLGVFLSDLVIQLISNLISQLRSSRCPSKIQETLRPSVDLLQERFTAWKQISLDCRAIFVCLSLMSTGKPQEAYVLINSVLQSRNTAERSDMELGLPDSKLWISSPFFRLSAVVVLLDSILRHVEPRVEVDAAVALVSTTSSEKDESVIKKISEKLCFPDEIKLKPIPCKPILFDLAQSNILPPALGKTVSTTAATGLVGKLTSWWKK